MGKPNFMAAYEIYDDRQLGKMKLQLKALLDRLCLQEKNFCARKKKIRMMTDEKRREIDKIVDACGNPFQVEAVNRIIRFYNLIPTTKEVEAYGAALRDYALGKTQEVPIFTSPQANA